MSTKTYCDSCRGEFDPDERDRAMLRIQVPRAGFIGLEYRGRMGLVVTWDGDTPDLCTDCLTDAAAEVFAARKEAGR